MLPTAPLTPAVPIAATASSASPAATSPAALQPAAAIPASAAVGEAAPSEDVEAGYAELAEAQVKEMHGNPKASPHAPAVASHHMDHRHAVGDVDLLKDIRAADNGEMPHSSGAWSLKYGLLLSFLVLLAVGARRVQTVWRNRSTLLSGDVSRSGKMMRVLSALSPFNMFGRSSGGILESPLNSEQRVGLMDGKRERLRKDVRVSSPSPTAEHEHDEEEGTPNHTHGTPAAIELSSMTASLQSVHVPKLIYLHSAGDDAASESPGPERSLLTSELLAQLLPFLPPSVQLHDIKCQYKLSVCGASLNDLYERCADTRDSLTLVQDEAGFIFGCYVSSAWSIHQTYYGSATCFVFTLQPHFRVYEIARGISSSSGIIGVANNSFFQLATRDAIAVGGGDHFALWLDDALRNGNSRHCDTFNSPCLSSKENFRCIELEVWSFEEEGSW